MVHKYLNNLNFSTLQRLQPLIYPTHTLLGHNVMPYTGAGTSLSPAAAISAAAAHYSNASAAYDFANQYNQGQLDQSQAASFPYGSAASNAALAASAAALASNPNVANYAYAALAQQALPSLTAAYQQ
jgi:hypothetical protein